MRVSFPLGVLVASLAAPVFAAEVVDAEARHTRVALFKNGLAVVETRVTLRPGDGEREYRVPLPPARFGSFWMQWPDHLAIEDVHSTRKLGEERVVAVTVRDMLRASVGADVSVRVGDDWHQGKLLPIPQRDPQRPEQPSPHDPWRSAIVPGAGMSDVVMIQSPEGEVTVLPLSSVTQVRLKDVPADLTVGEPKWEDVLAFTTKRVGEAAADAPREVVMHYLVQGLAWSPSYTVDISDDKLARVSAKAEIVNDFDDLAGVAGELVAGYPHLTSAHVPAAMSLQPMDALLAQLREAASMTHLAVTGNVAGGYLAQRAEYAPAAGRPSMPTTPVGGEASEDLFFFKLDDLTLAQHDRLYHPLFAAEVPYTHCYTWDVPNYIDEQQGYQQQPAEAEQVVWHAVRLTNTTGQPWTTAPGMTVKDGRVLGQDAVSYTPPGGETDLRITQAVSIKGEQSEHEVERTRNAAQFYGYNYDRVTVAGELMVTNFRDGPVTVQITKTVSGEVESAERDPEIVKLAKGLRRVNPTSKLTWNVEVRPGQEHAVKVPYRYSVYVRN